MTSQLCTLLCTKYLICVHIVSLKCKVDVTLCVCVCLCLFQPGPSQPRCGHGLHRPHEPEPQPVAAGQGHPSAGLHGHQLGRHLTLVGPTDLSPSNHQLADLLTELGASLQPRVAAESSVTLTPLTGSESASSQLPVMSPVSSWIVLQDVIERGPRSRSPLPSELNAFLSGR